MRAMQLVAWKHEPEFNEVDDPEPGPGEVRIRVGGAGPRHSELHLMHDFDDEMLAWPDAPHAYQLMSEGKLQGRAVVVP